jgi:hypothetical protein
MRDARVDLTSLLLSYEARSDGDDSAILFETEAFDVRVSGDALIELGALHLLYAQTGR